MTFKSQRAKYYAFYAVAMPFNIGALLLFLLRYLLAAGGLDIYRHEEHPRRMKESFASFPRAKNRLESIEMCTPFRTVSIETLISNKVLARCNPQEQCALFVRLPAEIRAIIFTFALTPIPKGRGGRKENLPFPPHCSAAPSAALLLTCRRIWLEANGLISPPDDATVWFDPNHDTGMYQRYHDPQERMYKYLSQFPAKKDGFLESIRVILPWHLLHDGTVPFKMLRPGSLPIIWPIHTTFTFWYKDHAFGPQHFHPAVKGAAAQLLEEAAQLKELRELSLEFMAMEEDREDAHAILDQISKGWDCDSRLAASWECLGHEVTSLADIDGEYESWHVVSKISWRKTALPDCTVNDPLGLGHPSRISELRNRTQKSSWEADQMAAGFERRWTREGCLLKFKMVPEYERRRRAKDLGSLWT